MAVLSRFVKRTWHFVELLKLIGVQRNMPGGCCIMPLMELFHIFCLKTFQVRSDTWMMLLYCVTLLTLNCLFLWINCFFDDACNATVAALGPSEEVEIPKEVAMVDSEAVDSDGEKKKVWDITDIRRSSERGPSALDRVKSLCEYFLWPCHHGRRSAGMIQGWLSCACWYSES